MCLPGLRFTHSRPWKVMVPFQPQWRIQIALQRNILPYLSSLVTFLSIFISTTALVVSGCRCIHEETPGFELFRRFFSCQDWNLAYHSPLAWSRA
jgi:hypothetical protein